MPRRIQFQTLPRSSQKGTKNRGECHIESLQLHLLAPWAPLVHWGVTSARGFSDGRESYYVFSSQ